MYYHLPHINKVYEAMTALADHRIVITSRTTDLLGVETISASVTTSSGDRSYVVTYQPVNKKIMSNDNSAYRNHEISYPMIALMIELGELPRDDEQISKLATIHRNAINTQHKNDRDLSTSFVLTSIEKLGLDLVSLQHYAQTVFDRIQQMQVSPLGSRIKP